MKTLLRQVLPTKSLILVGLRGVGKTVLLNRVSDRATTDGFHTVLVEAHEEKQLPQLLLPPLRQILYSLDITESASEKVKRGFRVLRSFLSGVKAIRRTIKFEHERHRDRSAVMSETITNEAIPLEKQ